MKIKGNDDGNNRTQGCNNERERDIQWDIDDEMKEKKMKSKQETR